MPASVQPIPHGYHAVTPHLVCAGAAAAIDFYRRAFGAEETSRVVGPDGKLWNAAIRIGDSNVMLVDEMPAMNSLGPLALKGSPVTLHLYVHDTDAAVKRAVDAGAQVLMPAEDMFWGDRYAIVTDPYGHRWSIATHVRDVAPDEMRQAMATMSPDCG